MSMPPEARPGLTHWSGRFVDLNRADQRAVAELVEAGGAIQGSVEEILPRLRRTRMMALMREGRNGRIVGVASLKTPLPPYRQGRFDNAGVAIAGFENALELGYVVVHTDRRGQMLSGDLVKAIAASVDETAFATTDSNTMCNNLQRSGFTRVGAGWQGSKGILSLWILDPRRRTSL